ncbi:MAG: AcrR family transcriptional regulator [Candidatus Eremiobacteraeota bacterium]|nr:AcrR family transcriptional regulator [Candidatus Eremiobacteraeota bacterium]
MDPLVAVDEAPPPRPDILAGETVPAPPQQKRSRRTHEALVASALAQFAAHGYEATTVEGIARDAGVAVGAFYVHFRSKRQALLVLMDRLLRELDTYPVLPMVNAAVVMNRLAVRFSTEWQHAGIYRALREASLRDPVLAALHAQIEAWSTERTLIALRVIASTHPAVRTDIDIGTLSWIVSVLFWRALEKPPADREAASRSVMTFIEHMLFRDGDSPRTMVPDPNLGHASLGVEPLVPPRPNA